VSVFRTNDPDPVHGTYIAQLVYRQRTDPMTYLAQAKGRRIGMTQKFEGNDGLDLPAGKRSIYKRTKENQRKAQMISEREKKN
jgi:hypothetical protein